MISCVPPWGKPWGKGRKNFYRCPNCVVPLGKTLRKPLGKYGTPPCIPPWRKPRGLREHLGKTLGKSLGKEPCKIMHFGPFPLRKTLGKYRTPPCFPPWGKPRGLVEHGGKTLGKSPGKFLRAFLPGEKPIPPCSPPGENPVDLPCKDFYRSLTGLSPGGEL